MLDEPGPRVAAQQPDSISSTEDQTKSDQPTELLNKAAESERLQTASKKEREEYYELLLVLADTIDQIDRNYVEQVSRRELVEAAIEGAIRKLDAYSDYIDPEELDNFKVEVDNEFGGLGIQIGMQSGQLRVISPLVGTPAYRAGIQAGDLIIKIDETPTKGLNISDAVKLMKGRPGTDVTLTVYRPLTRSEETVTVKREVIKVETVLGNHRDADDQWSFWYDEDEKIAHVRLVTFGRETARDLRKVVSKLDDQGLKALILDLRFNPGGLLRSAVEVSDLFLDSGTIVSMEGRNIESQSWDAEKQGTIADVPMAVLVNQYSASASEIVAAALQDHGRAVVVGQQTFGKASIQNVVELEDGKSAIKITTGSYQRPSGKPIHRFPEATEWGVKPDEGFDIPLSNYELGRLMRRQRQQDIVAARPDDRQEDPKANIDPQLSRAAEHLLKPPTQDTEQQDTEQQDTEQRDTEQRDTDSKPADEQDAEE